MDSEFILNDLIAVERKLERLAEERKKGGGRDKAIIEREIVLFERFNAGAAGRRSPCATCRWPPRKRSCSPASASSAASRC